MKKVKAKKGAWFVKVRGSYLPASFMGWLTYIPYISYLGFSALAVVGRTNSAAVAVLLIVPNWVAATVVMTYIAARNS